MIAQADARLEPDRVPRSQAVLPTATLWLLAATAQVRPESHPDGQPSTSSSHLSAPSEADIHDTALAIARHLHWLALQGVLMSSGLVGATIVAFGKHCGRPFDKVRGPDAARHALAAPRAAPVDTSRLVSCSEDVKSN